MTALPSSTDVVIVGAGPTGLALACVLAGKGVDFVLIERQPESPNTSRAVAIHAHTLEVLEELKVTPRLVAEGRSVRRFIVRDRDRVLAAVPFHALPTRYPYALMVPQQITEAILSDRLRELGGRILRPHAVADVQQDGEGVSVSLDGERRRTIRARYLVGADGMHSTVRERAGIGFTGEAYPHSFVLADVRMQWQMSADEAMLFLAPEGLAVVAPLPGDRHRIVATLDDAPEHPTIDDVQRLLDTRGPIANPARVREVLWSSRFRVHHRLADQYRAGRILLAGDAAHVHSPAGGQGMNTGIQDAMMLGRALSSVVLGLADERQLDEYERRRRPVAKRVVAFTDRMTRMATLRSTRSRRIRNAVLQTIGRLPAIPRKLATELAGLRNRETLSFARLEETKLHSVAEATD
jgi:2-polyprenyl-6-methoxyphenol hydroxylase-like FAD-dependent oxidoreductase